MQPIRRQTANKMTSSCEHTEHYLRHSEELMGDQNETHDSKWMQMQHTYNL